jgi:hypothetical protein
MHAYIHTYIYIHTQVQGAELELDTLLKAGTIDVTKLQRLHKKLTQLLLPMVSSQSAYLETLLESDNAAARSKVCMYECVHIKKSVLLPMVSSQSAYLETLLESDNEAARSKVCVCAVCVSVCVCVCVSMYVCVCV